MSEIKNQGRSHLGRGFLSLLLVLGALTFWVASPLITSIAWAIILAYVMYPIKKWLEGCAFLKRSPNLTAALTVVFILVGVLVPLIILGNVVTREIVSVYKNISAFVVQIQAGGTPDFSQYIPEKIIGYLTPLFENRQKLNELAGQAATTVAPYMGRFSTAALQWTGAVAFETIMVLFFVFFFVRDGQSLLRWLRSLSPLEEKQNQAFFARADQLLRAILGSVILIVAIQALLAAVGWWFVGLPRAALAGVLMFFVGLFPAGTAVIWGPGSLYLFATGDYSGGTILLLWGTFVAGLVDNILRPFLMNVDSVPTLAILVGLIGGLLVMGFLGIFFGPLIVALFLMMLDFYKNERGTEPPQTE